MREHTTFIPPKLGSTDLVIVGSLNRVTRGVGTGRADNLSWLGYLLFMRFDVSNTVPQIGAPLT